MYEFHYDNINNKFSNKSRLLFTDTDSLMYEIETGNIYDDFSKVKEMFDFSNYSARSIYHDHSSTLVFSKMKDEISGIAIDKFVGLKPKMYSILVSNCNECKKAKTCC